jgi:hypothetical protein
VCASGRTDSLARLSDGEHEGFALSEQTPLDPIPAELAPFVANAQVDLAAATDGLQPHEVIEHLETAVARAEFEASRLGIRFDQVVAEGEGLNVGEGGPVVVIRRLVDPDES